MSNLEVYVCVCVCVCVCVAGGGCQARESLRYRAAHWMMSLNPQLKGVAARRQHLRIVGQGFGILQNQSW